RRNNENAENYSDSNWLEATISIKVPSFNALYRTNLCTNDLKFFYENVVKLERGILQEIQFTTTEAGLFLQIQQQKTGTLIISGKTDPGFPSFLQFSFKADNMELDHIARQLEDLLKQYPIINA